tara:strand:+ start:384 stop:581 length:198 start_codon:yes stop_codon:yes gene_type:complete
MGLILRALKDNIQDSRQEKANEAAAAKNYRHAQYRRAFYAFQKYYFGHKRIREDKLLWQAATTND